MPVKFEAAAFKVFSVESRIKIIELLKATPMTVNAMADSLGVTQSAVSQHLRVLKHAGLVDDERDGYYIFYSLNKTGLDAYRQKLTKIFTFGKGPGNSGSAGPNEVAVAYGDHVEKELKRIKKRIRELEKEKK